ncbi:hypothetical protein [Terriglobus sp. TAA 43]|uniref:hypothetical protein n=1 Tax=Terriglobus sp. TAA 43 TaxID=278961 RepID=UPI0006460E5C|nr:hypothetical protein [Terriglobus sp. TAA 43]
MTLYSKRLNNGRSEIWIDDGPHRETATNNVDFAIQKFAANKFENFYAVLHESMGSTASVQVNDEIVTYLGF